MPDNLRIKVRKFVSILFDPKQALTMFVVHFISANRRRDELLRVSEQRPWSSQMLPIQMDF